MLYLFIVFYIPINEESLMGYGYYVEFYLCPISYSASTSLVHFISLTLSPGVQNLVLLKNGISQ